MTGATKPLLEVTEEALTVLNRQLGVTDTMRFLSQFAVGHGNYTEERKELFKDLSLADMTSRIREMRGQGKPQEGANADGGG